MQFKHIMGGGQGFKFLKKLFRKLRRVRAPLPPWWGGIVIRLFHTFYTFSPRFFALRPSFSHIDVSFLHFCLFLCTSIVVVFLHFFALLFFAFWLAESSEPSHFFFDFLQPPLLIGNIEIQVRCVVVDGYTRERGPIFIRTPCKWHLFYIYL